MEEKRCPNCMEPAELRICPHCGADTLEKNAFHQLQVGTVLRGRYRVGRVLGQGGFGITYIGWDTEAERAVAVKEFYPASTVNRDISQSRSIRVNTEDMRPHYQASKERFLREFEALSQLKDEPVTVDILDHFEENDTAYIIMELIRGIELKKYVKDRGGRLTPRQTLELVRPLIRGLAHVHDAKLVHRDISPDNIMLQSDGRVRLLDFGAVRTVLSPDAEKDLSRSTESILKHGYAPMEQYRNRGGIGPWTDVYALCGTVWFCLTGQTPPDALSLSMEEEVMDWTSIPGLDPRHQAALAQGMAVRAQDRLPSMAALHAALYGAPAPKPEDPTVKVKKKTSKGKKKGILSWIPVALLLAAVVATGVWALLPQKAHPPLPPADLLPAETDPGFRMAVLRPDPLAELGDKDQILTVTFLSRVTDAPGDAVALSDDGRVLGWNEDGHVTIAAEGGVDGRDACARLFAGCERLTSVSFGGAFYTDSCSSMEEMFLNCAQLTAADVETLSMRNVTSLRRMFSGCSSLRTLAVGGWDLGCAMDLSGLFADCTALEELDVGSWDLSGARKTSGMFSYCTGLRELDVSRWDVSGVRDMMGTFLYCRSLRTLDVSGWDTSSATDMRSLFTLCSSLEQLDLNGWNTASVTDMNGMFSGCVALEALDLSGWDTSSVRDMGNMFQNCPGITVTGPAQWDLGQVTDYEHFMDPATTVDGVAWEELF